MTQLLTEEEIQERARHLQNWTVEASTLQCTRKFKDFIQAIEFVNKLTDE